MPVYRIHKSKNYTVMSNVHLRDGRLTLKAKGLMSLMLSLPETWTYSIAGFAAVCKEGKSSIRAAFKELEDFGYVVVEKTLPEKGNNRIQFTYHIFEIPNGDLGVSALESSVRFSDAHFETLKTARKESTDNKDSLSVKLTSKEDSQVSSSSEYNLQVSSGFVPPTIEEVKDFFATNMLDQSDAEDFWLHYQSQGWVRGNNIPVSDWHALAVAWNRRQKLDKTSDRKPKQTYDMSEFSIEHWERG